MKCFNFFFFKFLWYYFRSMSDKLSIKNNDHPEYAMFLIFFNSMIWMIRIFNSNFFLLPIIRWKERICFNNLGVNIHGIFRDLPWVFLSFFVIHSVEGRTFSYSSIRPLSIASFTRNCRTISEERLKLGWNRCLNAIFSTSVFSKMVE